MKCSRFLLVQTFLLFVTFSVFGQTGKAAAGQASWRQVNGKKYEMIDSNGFVLYYRYETEWAGKGSSMIRKGKYYFSVSADSDIMPLTIGNLERAFSANTKFRYALEGQFREDRELPAYDKFLRSYKVNQLYCMSR